MTPLSERKGALSLADAARWLDISPSSLRRLRHIDASFPTLRVGSRVLVPMAALEAWLDSRTGRVS